MIQNAKLRERNGELWLAADLQCVGPYYEFCVVMKEQDYLAVKIPGHKVWDGVGMGQGYAPARFMVFRRSGSLWDECISFPVRL